MTYEWTLEPGRRSNYLQDFDFDTYAVIDPVDHSIVVDVMGFIDVTEGEPYAFVLTGKLRLRLKTLLD